MATLTKNIYKNVNIIVINKSPWNCLQIAQKSINSEMDKWIVIYSYHGTLQSNQKGNKLLIHTMTWMILTDTMFMKDKSSYNMSPFM